jgi:hypothetical protein
MPPTRHRLRISALPGLAAALVLTAVTACDGGAPPAPGAVQGRVTGEGASLTAVTVELTGPVNRVAQTGADGRYAFGEVPAGAYVVSVRDLPPDAVFPAISRTASVTPGSTVNVDFQGSFIRTASIVGTVLSRSQGVSGVTVMLSGPDQSTTQTAADGSFMFPALRSGHYEVEISGYPATISFPSTRTTVQLQPGQQQETHFVGIPELTATVGFRSFEVVLPGGERVPADPQNLRGEIEIGVTVDPGQDTPDSVTVLLGSEVVAVRYLDGGGGSGNGSSVDLLVTLSTDAFDPVTGTPRFLNGERLLVARLATREGGPQAATASAQVRLQNADTFSAQVSAERGPVLSPTGVPWVAGDLAVTIVPVFFSPGRTLAGVTLDLRTAAGTSVARRSAVGSPPLTLVFPDDPGEPGTLAGYATAPGTVDRFQVTEARYGDGGFVPGTPMVVGEPVRVDQVAPVAQAFRLPRQVGTSYCCLDNWIGGGFLLASALEGAADPGIGEVETRIHAGPASATDAELLALPPVTRGSDLAETTGNGAYRALARLSDPLGNVRLVPLAPSQGNPLTGPFGAIFGVDRTRPSISLGTGGGTLPAQSTNPPPGSAWGLVVDDGGSSGFGPLPVVASIRRFGPSDPESGTCVVPGGDPTCTPPVSGLLHAVPDDAGPGYLRLEARSVDRGGNLSDPVVAWTLIDLSAPVPSALFLSTALVGGAEAVVGIAASDDVDLFRARLLVRYPGAGPGGSAADLPVPGDLLLLGTPFGPLPTTQASSQFRFPFIAGIQRAASGPGGVGAGGAVAPAQSFEVRVEDAALNVGTRSLDIPAPPAGALAGFGEADRGADGAVRRWTIDGSAGEVCRDGAAAACPPGTPSSLRLSVLASGESEAFQNPFIRVHFFALGPDPRWIGSTAEVSTEGGDLGGDPPRHRWELDWTPPVDFVPGSTSVVAVGIDAAGNGLIVAVPFEVIVRP